MQISSAGMQSAADNMNLSRYEN